MDIEVKNGILLQPLTHGEGSWQPEDYGIQPLEIQNSGSPPPAFMKDFNI